MNTKLFSLLTGAALLLAPLALRAQVPVAVAGAELAIPFGAVTGQLAATNDVFIFIGQERKDASFAIRRANIRDVSVDGDILTIETVEAVSGGTVFNFKITDGEASKMAEWARGNAPASMPAGAATAALAASATSVSGGAPTTGARAAADEKREPLLSYDAQHKHTFGACTGKLDIFEDRMSYDSLDDVSHSEQWQLQGIKEIERKNPYKVVIKPFVGGKETLELVGGGMSSSDFQTIQRLISKQRRP